MAHVALLRGINVGGKNVIPMSSLARTFARIGLGSVKTYIQSGNVLFKTSERDARALEVTIERALTKAYRYDATVVVRTRDEMAKILRGVPREWKKLDPGQRYYVLFLRHEIDARSILPELAPKPGIERIWYRPGVVFWSAKIAELGRSSVAKLTARPIYRQLTIRNLNTTRKLCELCAAHD